MPQSAKCCLDDAGASAEGLDTLDVDIFEGEASLGPFCFWAGDVPHGEVESASLKLSYRALFDQHLLFRNMLVGGLDIQVSRNPEGSIVINGIDLDQLAPSEETPQEQTAEPRGSVLTSLLCGTRKSRWNLPRANRSPLKSTN